MNLVALEENMDESFDENDAKQLEECVKKVMSKIKANRNRACFQNIQNFVNRRGKNVEMEKLKQINEDLTEKNIIVNKGKEGKESFNSGRNKLGNTGRKSDKSSKRRR